MPQTAKPAQGGLLLFSCPLILESRRGGKHSSVVSAGSQTCAPPPQAIYVHVHHGCSKKRQRLADDELAHNGDAQWTPQ